MEINYSSSIIYEIQHFILLWQHENNFLIKIDKENEKSKTC